MTRSAKKYMMRKRINGTPVLNNPVMRISSNGFKDMCNILPYAMTAPDTRCDQPPATGGTKEYPWPDVDFNAK